jgi:hypothetical protein
MATLPQEPQPSTAFPIRVIVKAPDRDPREDSIPEPDLPSYESKTEPELEEEIIELSRDHLRSVDEVGLRVYWLNEKYKTRLKRPGKGVKAFCERIDFDLNHWNYLVRKYTPDEKKHSFQNPALKIEQANNQPSLEQVKKLITKWLRGLSPSLKRAMLQQLLDWIEELAVEIEAAA